VTDAADHRIEQQSKGRSSTAHVLFAGRTTVDAVYRLDRFPEEDSKVFARAFRVAPGGPACKAAITHAMLGGRASLVSAVGGGPWAAFVRAELDRRKVELIDLAKGMQYETPLSTVMVSAEGATRTIVNPPLQNVPLNTPGPDWIPSFGDAPAVALSDGFYLAEVIPLLAACRDAGAGICLDGGSWKPRTDELAPLLKYAICSERFAAPGKTADPAATVEWFAERGVPHVAVTQGQRPIIGLDRGRQFEIDIQQANVVDTLGAGDVLHGAFCFYSASGLGFEEALRRAAGVATRSCMGMGIETALSGEGVGRASGG